VVAREASTSNRFKTNELDLTHLAERQDKAKVCMWRRLSTDICEHTEVYYILEPHLPDLVLHKLKTITNR
jgi:hypothetical protein